MANRPRYLLHGMTLPEACRVYGLNYHTALMRMRRGCDPERILDPARSYRRADELSEDGSDAPVSRDP